MMKAVHLNSNFPKSPLRISKQKCSPKVNSTNAPKTLEIAKRPSLSLCRRRIISVSNSQSLSANPDNSSEAFIKKENALVTFKEAASKLVGDPISGGERKSIRNELILLALPAVLAQAIDPFSQLMETAYIGRLGPVELASSGVAVSIFNIVSKIFNVPLLSVTTSFVAEEISKNNLDMGGERMRLPSVSSALLLALGIGIIEAIALFLGSGFFLGLMGVSPTSPMRYPSELFLKLRALGAPAVVLSLAIQGVFRGFKDTKTPVLHLGLGNISSVVLLPVLVYSVGLGVTGAALATVLSQYLSAVLLLWSLSKRAVILPPKMQDLHFGGYIKSGGLLLGRTVSVLLTMTLGTAMATRQGPIAMAAHQICYQIWLAVSLLSDALAVSAQALIAGAFAKQDYKKVKEVAYYALKIGVFAGLALTIGLSASFGKLAELFTKDPEVLQIVLSGAGILFVSASQPINALAFIYDGLHYGVSDFQYAAIAMMTVGAISSLFLLIAPKYYGLPGVWVGLTLFMGLRMLAGVFRLQLKSGPWWFLHREDSNPEVLPVVDDPILPDVVQVELEEPDKPEIEIDFADVF